MPEIQQVYKAYEAMQKCSNEASPAYRLSIIKSYVKDNKLLQDILGLAVHLPFKCPEPRFSTKREGTFVEAYDLARHRDTKFSQMPIELQYLVKVSSAPAAVGIQARMLLSQLQIPSASDLSKKYLTDVKEDTRKFCLMCPKAITIDSPVCEDCNEKLERATKFRIEDFNITGYARENFKKELKAFVVSYSTELGKFTFVRKDHPTEPYSPELPFEEYTTKTLSFF